MTHWILFVLTILAYATLAVASVVHATKRR